MKRVAISQSNYIPWRGYFGLIDAVDEFVLLDSVQYTRRDWRNRNRIKTAAGMRWLTIPVHTKGRYAAPIEEIRVCDGRWAETHWTAIHDHYHRAPHFDFFSDDLEALYLETNESLLTAINERFLRRVCTWLGITTPISRARDCADRDATERLVRICRETGASVYVSGPSARSYLDVRQFEETDIALGYADYSSLPVYPQSFPPFRADVSVIDLLLNAGPDAPKLAPAVDVVASL